MTTANFIHSYITDLARSTPLKHLSPADRELYLPELERRLEERIGLELIPKLGQENLVRLSEYIAKKDVRSEEWKSFWESAIPNFSEVLRDILERTATETLDLLAA